MAIPNNAPAHRRPSSRGKGQISHDPRRRQQALLDLYNSCARPQPAEDAERAHRTSKIRSTLRPIRHHSQSGSGLSPSWSARLTTSASSARHGSIRCVLFADTPPRTRRPPFAAARRSPTVSGARLIVAPHALAIPHASDPGGTSVWHRGRSIVRRNVFHLRRNVPTADPDLHGGRYALPGRATPARGWRLIRRHSSREDVAKRTEGIGLWIVHR